MRWWRWPVGLVVALALVAASLHLVGLTLPAGHIAQRTREIPAPIEAVSERIRQVKQQQRWRRDITAIEIRYRGRNTTRYTEISGSDRIDFELTEQAGGQRYVSRIVSTDLPFGGQWQMALVASGVDRTRLHIREEGVVHSPAFRTISRYFIGHTATMDAYLDDLARSFEGAD